jgi:hypothetical protein
MEVDLRLPVIWITDRVLLAVFGITVALSVPVWTRGGTGHSADHSRWRRLGADFVFRVKPIFGRGLLTLGKVPVLGGMVHYRLYRDSLRRWAVHFAVLGSWLALGAVSVLTGANVPILTLPGFGPDLAPAVPSIAQLIGIDVGWVTRLIELLGSVVLGGMFLVTYRSHVENQPGLRILPTVDNVIGSLTLTALSGFPSDSIRMRPSDGGSVAMAPPMTTRAISMGGCSISQFVQWGEERGPGRCSQT